TGRRPPHRKTAAFGDQQQYPEEVVNIIKSAFTGGVVGWVYGGVPAFHQARRAFIERSQGELFQNQADAVQSAHRAGLRSFIRYGWRWSWRVAAFVAIFNTYWLISACALSLQFDVFSHFSLGEYYSVLAVLEQLSIPR
uniref:Complex I assembly factor TIMMDC1, mitochondrial n=1 Tax=Anser cygnoides TaxID=8845 RepID=A0A8B9DRY4_ANSCY